MPGHLGNLCNCFRDCVISVSLRGNFQLMKNGCLFERHMKTSRVRFWLPFCFQNYTINRTIFGAIFCTIPLDPRKVQIFFFGKFVCTYLLVSGRNIYTIVLFMKPFSVWCTFMYSYCDKKAPIRTIQGILVANPPGWNFTNGQHYCKTIS